MCNETIPAPAGWAFIWIGDDFRVLESPIIAFERDEDGKPKPVALCKPESHVAIIVDPDGGLHNVEDMTPLPWSLEEWLLEHAMVLACREQMPSVELPTIDMRTIEGKIIDRSHPEFASLNQTILLALEGGASIEVFALKDAKP